MGNDLHHEDGTHRTTARTANGSDVARHEARIAAHTADGHKHGIDAVIDLIRGKGVQIEDPDWANGTHYAVDFNNAVLGDPYLDGTGYLTSREEAEAVANEILPLLNAEAEAELRRQGMEPGDGEWGRWTHTDPVSYATIISEARKEGDENGDPVVEENYPQ